jgi:SAM-dependent methyltransferase
VNLERLYEYRFRGVDQAARQRVWNEIAVFLHRKLAEPERILDPAAGRGEFITAVPASERWAIDQIAHPSSATDVPGLRRIVSDVMSAELPSDHFDAIFVSNFLEHLDSQLAVAAFLERMRDATRPGGLIAVMGPNYRYCESTYWDCADHELALTHVAVEEHLYAAGFDPIETYPRFLPYSFRGSLPASRWLTSLYLRLPPVWRMLGKQFLVIGRR